MQIYEFEDLFAFLVANATLDTAHVRPSFRPSVTKNFQNTI